MKKIYNLVEEWYGTYGETILFDGRIEIDDEVIDAVNDEWRKKFYPSLTTPEKIAKHIAFNIVVNDATLSRLDGFANFPDEYAKILG